LKWAGGKRWLVSQLKPLWEENITRRYVEPFCGGLAVVLGLQPRTALLNDVNPHLINFYRQVQNGLQMRLPMRNDEELFYRHRERFNQLIRKGEAHTEEGAQLFYYLNRTCFNGLCRFNKGGDFNVPFGTYSALTKRSTTRLTSCSTRWCSGNGRSATATLRRLNSSREILSTPIRRMMYYIAELTHVFDLIKWWFLVTGYSRLKTYPT
jgi:DNA adenine methylase Dam